MRAFWILIVAVKVRPHRVAAGQFFYRWSVAFDFRKCRARREAKLLGEDVENARETYERRVFSNCSGRKLAEIKFAVFPSRHERRFNHKAVSGSKSRGPHRTATKRKQLAALHN